MKKLILILMGCVLLSSCAHEQTFKITDTDYMVAEPYGWANPEDKIDNVVYKVNVGNVVWSCILCETIVAPVILTGWYLYEPVKLKTK